MPAEQGRFFTHRENIGVRGGYIITASPDSLDAFARVAKSLTRARLGFNGVSIAKGQTPNESGHISATVVTDDFDLLSAIALRCHINASAPENLQGSPAYWTLFSQNLTNEVKQLVNHSGRARTRARRDLPNVP